MGFSPLWSVCSLLSMMIVCSSPGQPPQDRAVSADSTEVLIVLRDDQDNPVRFPDVPDQREAYFRNEEHQRAYRVTVPLPGEDELTLRLRKPRTPLLASGASVQWSEGQQMVAKLLPWRCLYEALTSDGVQDSLERPGTVVSICGGLRGVFEIDNAEVHVEPIADYGSVPSYGQSHVITTVPLSRDKRSRFFDDSVTGLGGMSNLSDSADGYSHERRVLPRVKREVFHRNPRHMEILLVADQTVVRFHGRSLVDQYLLTIMNIVNSVYHHPSLGIEINVIVVDMVHLSDEEMQSIIDGKKGKDTLQKFCSWSSERWHKAKAHRKRELFDVAVYLTKEDLGPAGYAPVTGMCNPQRSCAVIRDDGISSAFVVAHEIGHIFGMVHDGEGSAEACTNDVNDGKIMSAMVQSNYHSYYWSNCSRQMMEAVLGDMYCLENEPAEVISPRYSEPYGQTWTLDEQCRQEFGADFVFCSALPPNCEHLWCENPKVSTMCKTKKSPPLSGTTCGKNMWCLDGQCVNMKDTPRVDGGWAEWSEWGSCSRTCGVGVQYRYRMCTNPIPQYGGKECSDSGEDFRLCNKEDCPEVTDFRLEQCQYYNNVNFLKDMRHNWLPIESKNMSELCKLTCVSEETGDLFTTEKNVVDGTPCSYESSHNICIRGECHRMGCDKVLDSDLQEDLCGICDGDNSNCSIVDGTYTSKLGAGQYHRVLILPAQAMNIRIREKTTFHLAHFIAVRDLKTEKFWLNGETKPHTNRQFVVHKTRFLYFKSKNGEYLTARGPLLSPLEILVYSFSERIPVRLDYQYYTLKENAELELLGPATEPNRYQWAVTSFDNCTRPCGGGTKREMFECLDIERNTVSEGLCAGSERPGGATVPCNEHLCSTTVYLWEVKSWQKCSQSCGTKGLKWRPVYCEATLMENRWQVDDRYCDPRTKPDSYKQCNRMACPGKWKIGEWSECSASCGEGQQTRDYYCDKPNDDNKYTCDHLEPPTTHRTCQVEPCPGGELVVPPTDDFQQYSENHPGNASAESNASDSEEQSGESEVDAMAEGNGRRQANDDRRRTADGNRNDVQRKGAGGKHFTKTTTNDRVDAPDADKRLAGEKTGRRARRQRLKKNKLARRLAKKKRKKKQQQPPRANKKSKTRKNNNNGGKSSPKRVHHKKTTKINKHVNSLDEKPAGVRPCAKDLSGLVCKLAANEANCLTNSIYQKLCCKSCRKFANL